MTDGGGIFWNVAYSGGKCSNVLECDGKCWNIADDGGKRKAIKKIEPK